MARTKVRLELDPDGIAEVLKSDDIGDLLEEVADGVVERALASSGRYADEAEYTIRRFIGRDRVRVHVGTGNYAARAAEAQLRALTRALGGG